MQRRGEQGGDSKFLGSFQRKLVILSEAKDLPSHSTLCCTAKITKNSGRDGKEAEWAIFRSFLLFVISCCSSD